MRSYFAATIPVGLSAYSVRYDQCLNISKKKKANRSFFGAKKTILLCHTWEQDGVVNMIIITSTVVDAKHQ